MFKFLSACFLFLLAFFSLSANEQTLALIKPDAVKAQHIGEILTRYEQNGLRISALKMTKLDQAKAEKFYAVHKERPFFRDLVTFMSSGPIVAIVLEGDQAVAKNRELMGATNFKEAAKGTLRADFAKSMTENAVHGSDAPETAKEEISFFFAPSEIY